MILSGSFGNRRAAADVRGIRDRIGVDPVDHHERLTFSNYELASRADPKTGVVICITSNTRTTRFDNVRYISAEHAFELANSQATGHSTEKPTSVSFIEPLRP
ncbi:hypothetical protein [Nocardia fluminea]|uniref:hypothetical protein n=1 Tax=Nocardia fluminea TaxID=134984 RepID=UPI00117D7E42|nr:hypothetical protein [Nocardia fluminea]